MTTHQGSIGLRNWLVFLFLCLTWGSSFILIKKGLVAFSPDEVAVLRMIISSLAFVPVYFLLLKERVPWNKFKYVALVGILGNGIPAFLYAHAQTHVESSVAGILNSLTPIFTWLLGLFFFSANFRINQLAGVLIGFLGAAAIVLLNSQFQFNLDPFTLLIVIATVSYGLSANLVKTHLQDVNSVALTAVALFTIGIPALIYSFTTDIYPSVAHEVTARWSLLAIAALALIGTAVANFLFFRLIQDTNAVFGSSVAYLIPVTALGWGMLDGEALGLIHVVGMVLILAGIYLLRK